MGFHLFKLCRFLTYNYLACFNLKLLLAPITLSYDWTMDSIPLVEGLADTRNILTVLMYMSILLVGFCAVCKVSDWFQKISLAPHTNTYHTGIVYVVPAL